MAEVSQFRLKRGFAAVGSQIQENSVRNVGSQNLSHKEFVHGTVVVDSPIQGNFVRSAEIPDKEHSNVSCKL